MVYDNNSCLFYMQKSIVDWIVGNNNQIQPTGLTYEGEMHA